MTALPWLLLFAAGAIFFGALGIVHEIDGRRTEALVYAAAGLFYFYGAVRVWRHIPYDDRED